MNADLFDPDTSDLVPAADSGIQTEPAVVMVHRSQLKANGEVLTMADLPWLADLQTLLTERDSWLKSRVAYHLERCPF